MVLCSESAGKTGIRFSVSQEEFEEDYQAGGAVTIRTAGRGCQRSSDEQLKNFSLDFQKQAYHVR